ncbi:MAG: hypothetical protein MJD61_04300 [Proteobacteria bacterium]|nr:hypothetical protein [Pseudomonadota bacterium]
MLLTRYPMAMAMALACVACSDLDGFRTGPGELYRGTVVGGEQGSSQQCTAGPTCSFIRRGLPSRTRIELSFDPGLATQQPGQLALLVGAATTTATLTAITPLAHDPLSRYEFPGGGRVRNYIFGLDRPLMLSDKAHSPMVFLSLMEDSSIELRLVTPSGGLFGVFPLRLEAR